MYQYCSHLFVDLGKYLMESSSSSDAVGQCVNGVTTSGSLADPHSDDVESLHTEVTSLRNELSKKQDLLVKLQDRERQLRERSTLSEILVCCLLCGTNSLVDCRC